MMLPIILLWWRPKVFELVLKKAFVRTTNANHYSSLNCSNHAMMNPCPMAVKDTEFLSEYMYFAAHNPVHSNCGSSDI